ncbi:hypothetical protein [Rhizorhapis sp.]|uniref:hypothetical protein n=1 Tax=Rhizorhapis sp. TaxID=1968842 RepID=UPI002B491E51|nr:hypothetical protein [Rhizorhapis sp.]
MLLLVLGGGSFLAVRYAEQHYPEHLPWTPLDLDDPIGTFTGCKLSALAGEPHQCRQLLDDAQIDYRPLPSRTEGPHCGYDDAVLPDPLSCLARLPPR